MDENLSKNEQERLARLAASKTRKLKKLIIWILILAAIGGGGYLIADYANKADERRPGMAVPDIGQDHYLPGEEHPPYNSNPPTSGPHYPTWADWGVHEEILPDELLVHNLEHGGIWISYRDQDDGELIGQLRDIVDDYALKVVMTPRPQNDTRIAAAAWGRLLTLEEFDREQITDFIRAFINKGPEQVPY